MMSNTKDRVMVLLSIIERGKGKPFMDMLDSQNIRFHIQTVGYGTVPSEMMDILGLGSYDKDVILSLANRKVIGNLIAEFGQNAISTQKFGGLSMAIPLSAINRITSEMISRSVTDFTEKGENVMDKNEHTHNLILIAVNRGYTEQIMQTARKAGATGGTVISARLAGVEQLLQISEATVQEEKEIIAILAPVSACVQIMNDVNAAHGIRTEANGIVLSVPVEKAFKL